MHSGEEARLGGVVSAGSCHLSSATGRTGKIATYSVPPCRACLTEHFMHKYRYCQIQFGEELFMIMKIRRTADGQGAMNRTIRFCGSCATSSTSPYSSGSTILMRPMPKEKMYVSVLVPMEQNPLRYPRRWHLPARWLSYWPLLH
jgi:hypothetical protein